MTKELYNYYVLFPNHHEGLRLYGILKEAGVKGSISPTPREASSFCGMSLLIPPENVDRVEQLIQEHKINIEGIVKLKPKTTIWHKSGDD
ncbi:MAG: DUF3343 domain-containing protein [Dehalobacterium sp.]